MDLVRRILLIVDVLSVGQSLCLLVVHTPKKNIKAEMAGKMFV
ncbi:MAG: hypothetical protein AABX04_05505 [Nanoarchaeota archaeon]